MNGNRRQRTKEGIKEKKKEVRKEKESKEVWEEERGARKGGKRTQGISNNPLGEEIISYSVSVSMSSLFPKPTICRLFYYIKVPLVQTSYPLSSQCYTNAKKPKFNKFLCMLTHWKFKNKLLT